MKKGEKEMENMKKTYQAGAEVPFRNHVTSCIGTGRMGLALQKEYMDQLALVQKEIGFSYIRGHGLFCEDMAIYQEYEDEQGKVYPEYNFTYLDLVMDSYQSVGLKPFLELGFMPGKMASGDQTVFYWKGNVTPPSDYAKWCDLVQATLRHLMERYGAEEVLTWPIEVWNEPNLPGFWKGADMEEYFHLFEVTFKAIKEIDVRFGVGGPAICGVDDERWIRCFMEFCREKNLAIDLVTRHHYTTETPQRSGHYIYQDLMDPMEGQKGLQVTRDIVDSFEEYKGLPIHVTEFNTSYVPNNPLHDTNQNAAFIAGLLSWMGDMNESYSYWTFGDIFEEQGVPFTPFHGGFGLVANGCIPKPTFYTFKFFSKLNGTCILRTDDAVVMKTNDRWQGVLWNSSMKRTGCEKTISIEIPTAETGCPDNQEFLLLTQIVDEETCNPRRLWHEMGQPSSLSAEQKVLLIETAKPQLRSCNVKAEQGKVTLEMPVKEFGVQYFELIPVTRKPDRGYQYDRL